MVTDQQFRQVFEAYLSLFFRPGAPRFFITVDSAWHTYHVLLEDGVRQVETAQAGRLRRFSERLYKLASQRQGGPEGVYRDLAAFAGVGLALQDPGSVQQLPDDRRKVVAGVLAAIREGGGPNPDVLFFSLPLMPEQFRPAGFYTRTEALSRYFAARQWYATRAFRLESDAETLRAMHMALLIDSDAELKRTYQGLTAPYEAMVGPADDPDARQYVRLLAKVSGGAPNAEKVVGILAAFRREAARLPAPRVNDQWLTPADYAHRGERTRGMRVLPARRVPSAVLFQNTVHPEVRDRMFPSGVDVFAAGPLACEAGRRALAKSTPEEATAKAVMQADCGPLPESLHGEAMRLLALLQKPLPDGAPIALRSAAWQDKQLWTGLAAWAEERHTWALQAKMTMHYGGGTEEPPGYVSPYPDFYRRLGQLARRAAGVLQKAAAGQPDLRAAGREWLAHFEKASQEAGQPQTISMEEIDRINRMEAVHRAYFERLGRDSFQASNREQLEAHQALRESARRCAEGKGVTEDDRRWMGLFARPAEGQASELLPEFAALCDRLTAIGQKELEGKPLDADDTGLIRGYGKTLARFHFYGGNSYLTPRDDFPIVAPVFASPYGNRAEILYAGLGRPEAVYVILDVKGQPVLYRGAVLAYREFRRPIGKPLDDRAWAEQVYSGQLPPAPALTASFRRAIGEDEVIAMLRQGKVYPDIASVPGQRITRAMIDAIAGGKLKYEDRLGRELSQRATQQDVPALLELLQKVPPDQVGEVALCVARLDWKPHRDKLVALLAHKTIQVADAAAYVLSERPERIDVAGLADAYDKQALRTRRFYCYLIGRVKDAGPRGREVLLKALGEEHPAIRYQAAAAVARCGARSPEIAARLTRGIDDENEFTAAAMVHALVKLGVKEAAPKMLLRLQKDLLPKLLTPEVTAQMALLTEGTSHSGTIGSTVLACCQPRHPDMPWRIGSLPEELIAGLADMDYQPARPRLHAMLYPDPAEKDRGRDWSGDALDALVKLEPQNQRKLLLEAATGAKADTRLVLHALDSIARTNEPSYVEALVPLVEKAGPEEVVGQDRAYVGQGAAQTVGQLLEQIEPGKPDQEALYRKVRARLLKMFRGPAGEAAMDALSWVERGALADELLAAALEKKADAAARVHALELLGEVRDLKCARPLLPLLEDDSPTGHHWYKRIREAAANAIAHSCEKLDPKVPDQAETLRLADAGLEKMLRGPSAARAIDALLSLHWKDEKRQAELLMRTAGDRSLPRDIRIYAVQSAAVSRDRRCVRRLVPLLDENTRPQERVLSIGEHAANAIAELLEKEDRITEYSDEAKRARIFRQVRAWAEAEEGQ